METVRSSLKKLKIFCTAKKTINKNEKTTYWIFANHISDEGLTVNVHNYTAQQQKIIPIKNE